jgi:MFS family permease/Ca2+-binding EF-hand superfamily protein
MTRRSKLNREDIIPPDDLGQLLAETNFTKREIIDFYRYASTAGSPDTISKKEFGQLCFENDVKNAALVDRLWKLWDTNADGKLSHFELVKGLNPLLRGDRAQLASFFFDLYDIDGNADLTSPEVIAVYSDMLNATQGDASEGLTAEQKNRLRAWVHEHQNQHGRLDKESFVEAVRNMSKSKEEAALLSWRTAYYVFLTAWFEMGTSFSLPAMGALSDQIKERFDTNDEGIGTLTSAYFFAAMVGPLAGGYAMDRFGPGRVVIGANLLVVIGAMLQAMAKGEDQLWLIFIGRLLLGFGGEITPFTTIEILGRLFPDYFGLMVSSSLFPHVVETNGGSQSLFSHTIAPSLFMQAGVRNLIQSLSGFLAFVLLPIWANAIDDSEKGTSFALWMCVLFGVISLATSTIVYFSMKKENLTSSAEEHSDQKTVSKVIRSFAKATTPKIPGCRRWVLPLSFFFAIFGIKAQYFAPFGFTAFSNKIYKEKFGQTSGVASFFSGFISLLAGLLSPFMGVLSDRIGKRSLCLTMASFLSVIGFGILAMSSSGKVPVWVASVLFALQYGFGDTVAYISIRFIVGVNRSGIGYGIYGIFGNLIATLVPMIGGFLMETSNGTDKLLWYFTGLMGLGTLCWFLVLILEGPRSLLELPADQVIETSDEDLKLAALSYVASPIKSTRPNDEDEDDNEDEGLEIVSTESHPSE